ncbi:MAG: hypothetical protein ACYTF1_06505 [Planctomycetota bacterium]|jgi:hypothetical protein
MNIAKELYNESSDRNDVQEKDRQSQVRRAMPQVPLDLEIDGQNGRFNAVVCDVGITSIGIMSEMPIKEGSRVRLRCQASSDKHWSKARVVLCTDTVAGYKIGLELEEE